PEIAPMVASHAVGILAVRSKSSLGSRTLPPRSLKGPLAVFAGSLHGAVAPRTDGILLPLLTSRSLHRSHEANSKTCHQTFRWAPCLPPVSTPGAKPPRTT